MFVAEVSVKQIVAGEQHIPPTTWIRGDLDWGCGQPLQLGHGPYLIWVTNGSLLHLRDAVPVKRAANGRFVLPPIYAERLWIESKIVDIDFEDADGRIGPLDPPLRDPLRLEKVGWIRTRNHSTEWVRGIYVEDVWPALEAELCTPDYVFVSPPFPNRSP